MATQRVYSARFSPFLSSLLLACSIVCAAPSLSQAQAATPSHTGTVRLVSFYSTALGIPKSYNIYLPPNYDTASTRYPVVYLFRGHEREWVNSHEDSSRGGRAVQDIADSLIAAGAIRPMILVMPGLSSDDNTVPGMGIDFLHVELAEGKRGLGTGRFERYLVDDLISHIDATYRTIPDRQHRGTDGFSLGGYTALMLAVRHPDRFASAGCYDGTHMWLDLNDPRHDDGPTDDFTWLKQPMFAPAFGSPPDTDYMNRYNTASLIRHVSPDTLARIRQVRFHIQSAAFDGDKGNIDRNRHIVEILRQAGIPNSFSDTPVTADAIHNWHYADLHITMTLPLHDRVFQKQ